MKRFTNLCHGNIFDGEEEIRFAAWIHQELQHARERLPKENCVPFPSTLSVESVSYEGPHNHASLIAALWRTKNNPISICIDDFSTFHDDSATLELESAIILFNFGVSYFCLSTQKNDNDKSMPELQCSFDLFEMAYDMVAGESTGFWDFDTLCPERIPLFLSRALVGAHSLKTIAIVLELTGKTNEAAKAKQSLQKVLMVVDELEESSESSVDSIAASAA